jgi:AcrR family transcriptional regulator
MPRETAAPRDLKEACVLAARDVIAERGVEHLSLREVARKLGVSHQAPYRHYPSRDHLLAEVMRRCFESFSRYLDAREPNDDPRADLEELGSRYLRYAADHPLEYRLMFGTPWPSQMQHWALARDAELAALHAFDVLRNVLRRIHGAGPEQRARVDANALFVWSTMHGLASIAHADAMPHLELAPEVEKQIVRHALSMVALALEGEARLKGA